MPLGPSDGKDDFLLGVVGNEPPQLRNIYADRSVSLYRIETAR
jgi:hypothetical protein